VKKGKAFSMHFPFDLRPFWCYRINSFVKRRGRTAV